MMESMPDTAGEWGFLILNLIVGGILMNLIARKLEGPFDKFLEWVHAPLQARSKARQNEVDRLIDLLESDTTSATLLYVKELNAKLDANTAMILVFVLFPSGILLYEIDQYLTVLLLIATLFLMVVGIYLQNKHALLTEAIRRYEKLQDSKKPVTSSSTDNAEI